MSWVCGRGIGVGDGSGFESMLFRVLRLGDFCHVLLILGLGCDGALLRGLEKRRESGRDRLSLRGGMGNKLNEIVAASTTQN